MGLTLPNFGDSDGMGMGMPMAVKGTWAEAEKKVLKTQAAVVTLPALLVMLMEGFVTEVTQPETEVGQMSRVEEAAKLILWVLGRLVERGERLSQDKVSEDFLTPFLAGWPEAHALLEELGVSTFELERDGDDELQPRYESSLPMDAVTLAMLTGVPVPPAPPVPPKAPGRAMSSMPTPVRKASPASSCGSENTIALIEKEILSWNCLSLEEQFETSSQLSRAETAESSGIWTSACSISTGASSVSVSASCYSKQSESRSSTKSGRSNGHVPPPFWKSDWDERMKRKGDYPEWI